MLFSKVTPYASFYIIIVLFFDSYYSILFSHVLFDDGAFLICTNIIPMKRG